MMTRLMCGVSLVYTTFALQLQSCILYIYTHIKNYIYRYTHTHTHLHIYAHAHRQAGITQDVHTHIRTHTHSLSRTCVYTHAYTQTHTHTYISRRALAEAASVCDASGKLTLERRARSPGRRRGFLVLEGQNTHSPGRTDCFGDTASCWCVGCQHIRIVYYVTEYVENDDSRYICRIQL
jgi:hypothetical protein